MEKNFSRRQFVTAAASAGSLAALASISPALGNPVSLESAESPAEKQTWKKIGSKIYGARADDQGPIGGGAGYKRIVTKGDFVAEDLETLIDVLGKAKS